MATSEATMNSLEKRGNYVLENESEQDIMMATNEISLEETMCLEHYEKENEQVITNATESQNYIESFDVKEWNYNVFKENQVKELDKTMKLANDLDVFKTMSLISIAILSRWPGMVMIFMVLITMAYGLQEEPQQGWKTKAGRRDWLKKRVKGREKRKERRLCRLSQVVRKRQTQVMMLFMVVGTAQSMETQQILQRITRLAEAANTAAQAATEATQAMTRTTGSSTHGWESATKILKSPDTFNGEDPLLFATWKLQFESWLSFGDSKFNELLAHVEGSTKEPDCSCYTPEQTAIANKFFAVLSSYLRGRCLQMVRANQQAKDGFKLWFQMCREFLPATRQRSLALAQTLGQYPNFNQKLSMMENILQFEQLVMQYEQTSKETYPSDLKTATLIRCAPQKLK